MENLLKELHDADIFAPENIYIFCERKNPEWDPGPIEFMYFIRNEDEILPALEMEIVRYLSYQIKKILGCGKVSESCYEFKMLCFDPEEGCDLEYSLYLHKIRTVQEAIREAYDE